MLKVLKKLVFMLAVASFVLLSVTGCEGAGQGSGSSDRVEYVEQFGSNGSALNYYCYTTRHDLLPNRNLVLYDIAKEAEKEIFSVEDPEHEYINAYVVGEDGVDFVVHSGDNKLVYHYEYTSGNIVEKTYSSDFYKGTSGEEASVITTEGTVSVKKGYNDDTYYVSYNDSDYQALEELTDAKFKKSGIFNNELALQNGKIYGVITAEKGIGHGPAMVVPLMAVKNSEIDKEILFEIDPSTEKCSVLYETKSSTSRIIGYQDGYVFLLKDNAIIKNDVSTKSSEKVCDLSCAAKDDISLCWVGKKLIVQDSTAGKITDVIDF